MTLITSVTDGIGHQWYKRIAVSDDMDKEPYGYANFIKNMLYFLRWIVMSMMLFITLSYIWLAWNLCVILCTENT